MCIYIYIYILYTYIYARINGCHTVSFAAAPARVGLRRPRAHAPGPELILLLKFGERSGVQKGGFSKGGLSN